MARELTSAWSRSFQATLPTTVISDTSAPCTTGAVRSPRFCWMRGLTVTLLASAAPLPA